MMDRQKGGILFECDACNEVLDTETSSFTRAKAMFDRENWKARQVGDEWLHACPKHHGSLK